MGISNDELKFCYSNSVLQALFSLECVREEVISLDAHGLGYVGDDQEQQKLAQFRSAVYQAFVALERRDTHSLAPFQLRCVASDASPNGARFGEHKQHDVDEYRQYLLDLFSTSNLSSLSEMMKLELGQRRSCALCGSGSFSRNPLTSLAIHLPEQEVYFKSFCVAHSMVHKLISLHHTMS